MKTQNTGIIAFCGSKFAGKSTSATIFKTLFQGETEELAFAEKLKKVSSTVFDLPMDFFLDPKLKEKELENWITLTKDLVCAVLEEFDVADYDYNKHVRPHIGQVFDTPRKLLQYVGTEILHPIDPLIHVKAGLGPKSLDKLSIVTDLRFEHEFEALKARPDFIPVYVYNRAAEAAAASDTHKSETDLRKFKEKCILLDNNGSLNDLTENLKAFMAQYVK